MKYRITLLLVMLTCATFAKSSLLIKPYLCSGYSNIIYLTENPKSNVWYQYPQYESSGRIYSVGIDAVRRWKHFEISGGLQFLEDGAGFKVYLSNSTVNGKDVYSHIVVPILANGIVGLGKDVKLIVGCGIVSSFNLQYKTVVYTQNNYGQQLEVTSKYTSAQFSHFFRRATFSWAADLQLETRLSSRSSVFIIGGRFYRMFSDILKDDAFKLKIADVSVLAGYGFKLK
jgi:hypothetical protein